LLAGNAFSGVFSGYLTKTVSFASALSLSCLLFACGAPQRAPVANERAPKPEQPSETHASRDAGPPPVGNPVFAEARYGSSFPRSERLPPELGGPIDARELRLVVEPAQSHAPLPFAKQLAAEHPGLALIVIESVKDTRTEAWLERSGLGQPVSGTADVRATLGEASRDERLLVPSARASQLNSVVERGIKRRHYEAYLLHGPWLIWHGAIADARYPLERAASGAWSHNELETFEDVPRLIREFYESRRPGHEGEADAVVQSLLMRPDVRPKLLLVLAESLLLVLATRQDVTVAQALADRAVAHTQRLEFSVSLGAAFVHHLTGDPAGSIGHGEHAFELCRQVQSDCGNVEARVAEWRRCPRELVERKEPGSVRVLLGVSGTSFLETQLRADAPQDCGLR
jgi:hypothetical protein